MRSDMHKVIVERPRFLRSAWTNKKTSQRLNSTQTEQAVSAGDDFDSGPGRAPSSRHEKRLNENLAPLKRYLQKQVGRPWDKVYSEISGAIDTRSAIGLHVLQHVEGFVALDTFLKDGQVWEYSWGRFPSRVDGLYVHPVTRLLRSPKPVRRARRKAAGPPPELTAVPLTRTTAYEKIGGLWYLVEYGLVERNGVARMEAIRKQQCGRKTIQRIEAGGFRLGANSK